MSAVLNHANPSRMRGRFTVGHDAAGHWVVCDRLGKIGGLFVSEAEALRFARRESNGAADAVRLAPALAALDAFAEPGRPRRQAIAAYCHAA